MPLQIESLTQLSLPADSEPDSHPTAEESDAFESHNRLPAAMFAAASGLEVIVGMTCCLLWGRLHWGALVGATGALVLAISSLALHRSRAGWWILSTAVVALLICWLTRLVGL